MLMVLVFVNITLLLGIATAILHFSDMTSDPKWERLCAKALLFTLVPVVVIPGIRMFRVPLFPLAAVFLVWAVMAALFLATNQSKHAEEDMEMEKEGYWKCSRCHEYNQKLSLVCWKCSARKDEK